MSNGKILKNCNQESYMIRSELRLKSKLSDRTMSNGWERGNNGFGETSKTTITDFHFKGSLT